MIDTPQEQVREDEIDLLELAMTVWAGRWTIFKFLFIFGLLGLFIAIFSPKEYTATTIMVPQTTDATAGKTGLGNLAALAGVDLGGRTVFSISPTLYPQVVGSIPFQKDMMRVLVSPEDLEQKIPLSRFYTEYYKPGVLAGIKKYTIGLPGVILGAIRGEKKEVVAVVANDGIERLNKEEVDLIGILKKNLTVTINAKEGTVQVSVVSPEALLSAEVVRAAAELLQKYITLYKIDKAQTELEYTQERAKEQEEKYLEVQQQLAEFQDRHRNINTERAKMQLQRLRDEYNLVYEVHLQLAKQEEAARLKVKEDTPVFTVIEPVSVPTQRSAPKRPLILILWLFLGGILGVGTIFGREFLKGLNLKRTLRY